MTKDDALNKKAENARELGLSYDWTPEEDEAFNEVEKHSNLGKQILRDIEGQPYVYAPKYVAFMDVPQRTWVGLTDEEAQQTFTKHNCTISTHLAGILTRAIEAKLKEKNT